MKTLRRYHKPGDVCFITSNVHNRKPILTNNVGMLWKAIETTRSRAHFGIIAWVILPDHLHMIIDPNSEDISKLLQRIKMSFAAYYRKANRMSSGRVWQNRFWDHIIRDDEDMRRHVDYIHYNPVKHGLVSSPFEWEHSSIFEFYPKKEWEFDLKLLERFDGADFGE